MEYERDLPTASFMSTRNSEVEKGDGELNAPYLVGWGRVVAQLQAYQPMFLLVNVN